jgi:hypothetical protein
MKKARSVGLVGSGEATRFFFSKVPALAHQLGPVKSSSIRIASRIVNGLRAGQAVSEATALSLCKLVLLCVADKNVGATVDELAEAGMDWNGRHIVLCDSEQDTASLHALALQGAHTASVNILYPEGKPLWIGEGDAATLREFKRVLLPRSTSILQLANGAKPVFLAGLTLASLPGYLHVTAVECMRAAGIGVGLGRTIAQTLSLEAIHAATKAGRQALTHRWNEAGWTASKLQLSALRKVRPDLADIFAKAIKLAGEVSETD